MKYNKVNQNQMKAKEIEAIDRKPKSRSIPLEVVIEILSWLPFKSLQRFKCVCRLWLNLLTDDPYFGKLHCERVMNNLALQFNYAIDIIDWLFDRTTFLQEVYECFYGNGRAYSFPIFVLRLKASGFIQRPEAILPYRKVSICNGLYSITSTDSDWLLDLSWPYYCASGRRSTLVLAPTPTAVQDLVMVFPHYAPHVCVDGNSVLESQRSFLRKKKVIIGTPGCVSEIMPTHSISPDCLEEFVLYNADELFARGFKDKIYNIFKLLPKKVKVVLISKRMPREAFEIPQQFWNQKAGQWNKDIPCGASPRSNRSLQVEWTTGVRHDKELIAMKAMWKFGQQERLQGHRKKIPLPRNHH